MAEYIKCKNLVDLVLSKLKYLGDARIMNQNNEKVLSEIDGYEKAMKAVYELILDNDLIENIQPVKHGKWIITDDVEHFIAICSECGRTEDSRAIKDMPYCHCGARMIKDGENNA